ncbi:MAG: hypothetical protein KIT09_00765 [Bryobacteraceae bacterium]|nr:hypothetical protein [Bryobacteraceae bacterium]
MAGKLRQFVQHVVPGVVRPMRVLWNEIIGFVFLALAVWAVPSTIRAAREFDGDADSFFRVVLAGLFAALMIGFGVTSFLRARRISRS